MTDVLCPPQDHLPIVADCLLPVASEPLAQVADLSVTSLRGEDESAAGSGFARGPGIAALIWAGILSVQLRTGLLSVSSPLSSFLSLRSEVHGATKVMGARTPIAVVLILVTEGSKLAVLLWAVATALRRRRTPEAVAHLSLDGAAEETTVEPSRDRLAEVQQKVVEADGAATVRLGTEV